MKQGLKVWQKNPILGVGYDRIAAVKKTINKLDHSQSAYSSTFITLLASTGIIGFLAFAYFLLVVFQSVDKIGKTAMIGVVVASLFDNVFLENFVLVVFMFIISLSLSRRSP